MSHDVVSLSGALRSMRRTLKIRRHLRQCERQAQEVCMSGDAQGVKAPDGSPDPHGEAGMATAEYAIGTLAAAACAGLLLAVMRSGGVQSLIAGIIESALSVV